MRIGVAGIVFTCATLLAALGAGLWIVGPGRLFDTTGFPPRWTCGAWPDSLGWLHVTADLAIFAAYLSIPIALARFAWHRRSSRVTALLWLFGAFILACGLVHLLEAVIFWEPLYRLSGVLKLLTATVSCLTVVALVRVMPALQELPGLARANQVLQREVEEGRDATTVLGELNRELVESRAAAVKLAAESDELRQSAERSFKDSRQAEAMSRLVIESAPNAQIMIDSQGRIVLFNQMAERIFGYQRSEVLGNPIELLVPGRLQAEHVVQRQSYMREPSAREMGAGRELYGIRKDGSEVRIEIGLNPIAAREGLFVLAGIIDITQRKKVEDELRRYSDALAASNLELEQFAQFASHDLQEPLRKLISFSELLVEDLPGAMPEDAKRDLDFITDAALRMRALVRGLLNLSRSSRHEMHVDEVPLDACLRDATEALSVRIDETRATLTQDPLPTVCGDRLLLTQLLQNLIGNALKFQAEGTAPIVHITCTSGEGGLVFGVRDNGIGIKSEYAREVFRPFKRLHGRGQYDGTGIGLAICQKAVERHGGKIWVESEPGQGAHFLFTLGNAPAVATRAIT